MKKLGQKNEKGFALLEAIVFMMGFVVLAFYTIDFFTVIHSGIVGSIGARTYLFETLQHRADIAALRQDTPQYDYSKDHYRIHLVNDEDQPPKGDDVQVTARRLVHSAQNSDSPLREPSSSGNPRRASVIYVKSGYGICVDAQCPSTGGAP